MGTGRTARHGSARLQTPLRRPNGAGNRFRMIHPGPVRSSVGFLQADWADGGAVAGIAPEKSGVMGGPNVRFGLLFTLLNLRFNLAMVQIRVQCVDGLAQTVATCHLVLELVKGNVEIM